MDQYETFLIEYIERSSDCVIRRRPIFYASPKPLNHDKFQSRLDNFVKQKQYTSLDEIEKAVENNMLKNKKIARLGGLTKCLGLMDDFSRAYHSNTYNISIQSNVWNNNIARVPQRA